MLKPITFQPVICGLTHPGPRPSGISFFKSITTILYEITDAAAESVLHNVFHIHPSQSFVCLMPLCFYLSNDLCF